MGLSQADTTAITDAFLTTLGAVREAVVAAGGFAWQYMDAVNTPSSPGDSCASFFRSNNGSYVHSPMFLEWTNASSPALPAVMQDIATFQLLRGEYAWIGFAWVGCLLDYPFPEELYMDVGVPLSPYLYETAPNSGIFFRNFTTSVASFDCNTWNGTVIVS